MDRIARKTKRILSIIMACMMIVSVIPASAVNSYASEMSVDMTDTIVEESNLEPEADAETAKSALTSEVENESVVESEDVTTEDIATEDIITEDVVTEDVATEDITEILEHVDEEQMDDAEAGGNFYWDIDPESNVAGWYKNAPASSGDSVKMEEFPNPGPNSFVTFRTTPNDEVREWLENLSGDIPWIISSFANFELKIGKESNAKNLKVDVLNAYDGNVTLYGSVDRLRVGADSIEVFGDVNEVYIGSTDDCSESGNILIRGNVSSLTYYKYSKESNGIEHGFNGSVEVLGTVAKATVDEYKYNDDLAMEAWVRIYTVSQCPEGKFKVVDGEFDSSVPLVNYISDGEKKYRNSYQCYDCGTGKTLWNKQIYEINDDGTESLKLNQDCEITDVEGDAEIIIYTVAKDDPVVLEFDCKNITLYLEGNSTDVGKVTIKGNVDTMRLTGYREAWDVAVTGNIGILSIDYYYNQNHNVSVGGTITYGTIWNNATSAFIGSFEEVQSMSVLQKGNWNNNLFIRNGGNSATPSFGLISEDEKRQALTGKGIGEESVASDGTAVVKEAEVSVTGVNNISEADVNSISDMAGKKLEANSQLIAEVDIDVSTYFVDKSTNKLYEGEGYEKAKVSETSDELDFTLLLPDSVYNKDAQYSVVRKHVNEDGTTSLDVLETEQDGKKISFASDKFSTYMVVQSESLSLTKLGTPSNFRCEKQIAKWDAVPNAQSYMLVIAYGDDDSSYTTEELTTVNTSLDLSSFINKYDYVRATICAIPKDATVYANSLVSEEIICEKVFFFEESFDKVVLYDTDNSPVVRLKDSSDKVCTGVTFKSSNPEVATIDSTGKIKAVSVGETTITATPKGYKSGLGMDIEVVKELYYVSATNTEVTQLASISKGFYYSDVDTVHILTSPADTKIVSVEYAVSGEGADYVYVGLDNEDETHRTASVNAICLDELDSIKRATVTFTVEDETGKKMSFDKEYDVYPYEDIPSLEGFRGYAFALRDEKIENVTIKGPNGETSLPGGWKWCSKGQSITKYKANNTYYFEVEYESVAYGTLYDEIPVTFETPDVVDYFNKLPATMIKGKENRGSIGFDFYSRFANDEFKIVSRNEKVLMATGTMRRIYGISFMYSLTAIKKGTAIVDLYDGNTIIASRKFTVVEGEVADILSYEIKDSDGKQVNVDGNNTCTFEMTTAGNEFEIITTAQKSGNEETQPKPFTTNITSSDSAVIKIKNGSKVASGKSTKVTIVGAGYATLTITVNDSLKTQVAINIRVIDRSEKGIVVDKSSFTIDMGKKAGTVEYNGDTLDNVFDSFNVCSDVESRILAVAFFDAADFDSKCKQKVDSLSPLSTIAGIPEDSNLNKVNKVYVRVASPESFKAGKYVMGIAISNNVDEKFIVMYKFVTFKKTSTKPSIKVTQLKTVDLLYADREVDFSIDGNGIICNDVQIEEPDGVNYEYSYNADTRRLHINNLGNAKQLTLHFITDDYKDVTSDVNVKTTTGKLKLSSTSGTLYNDTDGAYLNLSVVNSKGVKVRGTLTVLNNDKFTIDNKKLVDPEDEDNYEYISKLQIAKDAITSSTEKIKVKFEGEGLEKEYTFTYTVKTSTLKKAKLVLGAKSLTMYNYPNQGGVVTTSLKLYGGCDINDILSDPQNSVVVTEKVNSKLGASLNRTMSVEYDKESGTVYVTKASDKLVAGTYNYVFTFKNASLTKPISVTLPVKVVNKNTSTKNKVSVKVTAKNNVNLYDRGNTYVRFTPKFTNVPSNAKYELVGIQGKNAGYFNISYCVGQKDVPIKEDANIFENKTYSINLVYDVYVNGAVIRVTSPEVKIKFKTSKVTVKLFTKQSNVFSVPLEEKTIKLSAFCGYSPVEIERVELTNMTDAFESTLEENGSVAIKYKQNDKTKKGATYTLKYNVYIKDAARDVKPITVSYKIKIAQ